MKNDFNFIKDLRYIDWLKTVQVNIIRGFFAGIVLMILFFFIDHTGKLKFEYLVIWPLFAWWMLLPFVWVLQWLSNIGVPFIGGLAAIISLMFTVGDPFVFYLHKFKPEYVPIEDYGFFNLTPIIFVLDRNK